MKPTREDWRDAIAVAAGAIAVMIATVLFPYVVMWAVVGCIVICGLCKLATEITDPTSPIHAVTGCIVSLVLGAVGLIAFGALIGVGISLVS